MTPPIDAQVWSGLVALEAAGEPGFLEELVSEFLRTTPLRIGKLGGASERGDASALEREAHGLKGSCGAVGALRMVSLCDELETLGREARLGGAGRTVHALESELAAVRAALDALVAQRK